MLVVPLQKFKFRETGNAKYLNSSELHKACFPDDAAYSDSNDLFKRSISDKILKKRAYKIAMNPKNDRYQKELARMVYK